MDWVPLPVQLVCHTWSEVLSNVSPLDSVCAQPQPCPVIEPSDPVCPVGYASTQPASALAPLNCGPSFGKKELSSLPATFSWNQPSPPIHTSNGSPSSDLKAARAGCAAVPPKANIAPRASAARRRRN